PTRSRRTRDDVWPGDREQGTRLREYRPVSHITPRGGFDGSRGHAAPVVPRLDPADARLSLLRLRFRLGLLGCSLHVLRSDLVDGPLDDRVGLVERLADLDDTGVGDEGQDPRVARGDGVLELLLELTVVVALADPARRRGGRTEHRGAAEDRGREQHAERHAADEAP